MEYNLLDDIVIRTDVKHHLLVLNQVIGVVHTAREGHRYALLVTIIDSQLRDVVAGDRYGLLACP